MRSNDDARKVWVKEREGAEAEEPGPINRIPRASLDRELTRPFQAMKFVASGWDAAGRTPVRKLLPRARKWSPESLVARSQAHWTRPNRGSAGEEAQMTRGG